ncbi:MAG: hypothetical protein WBA12_02955 [Catalinimonas sp.]
MHPLVEQHPAVGHADFVVDVHAGVDRIVALFQHLHVQVHVVHAVADGPGQRLGHVAELRRRAHPRREADTVALVPGEKHRRAAQFGPQVHRLRVAVQLLD